MPGRFFAQRVFYGTWLATYVLVFVLGSLLAVWFLAKTGAGLLATTEMP